MRIDLTKEEVQIITSAMRKTHEILDKNKSQWSEASTLYWKLVDSNAQLDMIDWIERNTSD